MRILGLAIVVGGWVIAMAGLFITTSNAGRILFCVAGISVSLIGILGVLNSYFLQRAIWKK